MSVGGADETTVVFRIVLGACRRVGCAVFGVAGLIVVDDISRGPSILTILLGGDVKFDDAALPSLLIEKTM